LINTNSNLKCLLKVDRVNNDTLVLGNGIDKYIFLKLNKDELDSLNNPLLRILLLGKPTINYNTTNPEISSWTWKGEQSVKKRISVVLSTKEAPRKEELEKIFYELWQKEGKGYFMFTTFFYLKNMDLEWTAYAKANITRDSKYSFEVIRSLSVK